MGTNIPRAYQRIADIVVEGIESNGLQWLCPWQKLDPTSFSPRSRQTGKSYKGINVLLLSCEFAYAVPEDDKLNPDGKSGQIVDGKFYEYTANEWVTMRQCAKLGGKVPKGSYGTWVSFWNKGYVANGKYFNRVEDVLGAGIALKDAEERWSLKEYCVFNVGLCGIKPLQKAEKPAKLDESNIFTPVDKADDIVKGYVDGPKIQHGGDRACYHRVLDRVKMPRKEQFKRSDDYYHTLFHELVHSTGHESRLKRKDLEEITSHGDDAYSREELTAEIGAMLLSHTAGVDFNVNNAKAYLKGWVTHLKDHPKHAREGLDRAIKAVEHMRKGKGLPKRKVKVSAKAQA